MEASCVDRGTVSDLSNRLLEAICLLDALGRVEWKLQDEDLANLVNGIRAAKRACDSVSDEFFGCSERIDADAVAACDELAANVRALGQFANLSRGYDCGHIAYALEGVERLLTELSRTVSRACPVGESSTSAEDGPPSVEEVMQRCGTAASQDCEGLARCQVADIVEEDGAPQSGQEEGVSTASTSRGYEVLQEADGEPDGAVAGMVLQLKLDRPDQYRALVHLVRKMTPDLDARPSDESVHEQLASAVLELDRLAPGTADAYLLQTQCLLQHATMESRG